MFITPNGQQFEAQQPAYQFQLSLMPARATYAASVLERGGVPKETRTIFGRVLVREFALLWSSQALGDGRSSLTSARISFTSPVAAAETNCSARWRACSPGWDGGVERCSSC